MRSSSHSASVTLIHPVERLFQLGVRIKFHEDWRNLHVVGEDELAYLCIRGDTKPQSDAGQVGMELEGNAPPAWFDGRMHIDAITEFVGQRVEPRLPDVA